MDEKLIKRSIVADPVDWQELEKLAEQTERSVSYHIRKAVRKYLNSLDELTPDGFDESRPVVVQL